MATFSTYVEVLTPDHPLTKLARRMWRTDRPPGAVLADVLRQIGGAHEATTPLTETFRGYLREVAELTSDDELLRIAGLSQVPVSLESCRQLDHCGGELGFRDGRRLMRMSGPPGARR
jgi:hypothetical protein